MKVLHGSFKNFGSHKDLEFDFEGLGLSLIYGPTGVGKSTIPDMVAWTLFGVTGKNGAADDVKSWTADGESTLGHLQVQLNDNEIILVTRERGKKNDLYWEEFQSEGQRRGKDLNDTQRLLEERLGVDREVFLLGAYFHEFSAAGSFFTANAKDRRDLFEKIADTTLATTLGERCGAARKDIKKILSESTKTLDGFAGQRNQISRSLVDSKERCGNYSDTIREKIKEWEIKGKAFEKTKAEKIEALTLKRDRWEQENNKDIDKLLIESDAIKEPYLPYRRGDIQKIVVKLKKEVLCKECGQPKKLKELDEVIRANDRLLLIESKIDDLARTLNPYRGHLEAAEAEENTYALRIEDEKKKVNPFRAQVAKLEDDLIKTTEELEIINKEIKDLESQLANLDLLYDLSLELRGELLDKSVQDAQDLTNRYLEKYFDSEIRVEFALEGSDTLTMRIQKSGHDCVYKQLSKGQRGLLKLCFGVSIMKAATNKAGTHFDNIFFDEALDGLDSELKVKAFGMFEELAQEHESIMVIDHAPELQAMFENKYHVTMTADVSSVDKE